MCGNIGYLHMIIKAIKRNTFTFLAGIISLKLKRYNFYMNIRYFCKFFKWLQSKAQYYIISNTKLYLNTQNNKKRLLKMRLDMCDIMKFNP